jgi:hypothetical protein
MPTPLDADAIVMVVINQELYGQQVLNVLHFRLTDSSADYKATMNAMIDAFDGATGLLNAMTALQAPELLIKGITAQPLWPQRLAAVKNNALDHSAGVADGVALPSNVSMVISKKTDFAGQSQRGAFHLAGLTNDMVNGDEWTAGTMVDAVAIGDKLIEAIATGGFGTDAKPVLWAPGTPTVTADITDYDLQRTIRVMRRRTKGVGR